MMSYNTYPNLPSAPPQLAEQGFASGVQGSPEAPQNAYHLNVIQAKRQGLMGKEQMFKKKYEKYTKILNRLTWLNACLSSHSIATGISSVATFATFIGLPVSISLGAASLTGVIVSGIISTLTKKYQKKLKKVSKLTVIDEEEFNMLQTLHIDILNGLTGVNHAMEAEHRSLVKKVY